MEAIPSKEFLQQLNSGSLKSAAKIFGIVKKADDPANLQFAFKGDKSNWITIPGAMIDHVHILKTFSCEDETMTLVKMRLKEPSDPEAKVLFELLTGLAHKVHEFWMMKKMMMGKGMFGDWHENFEGNGKKFGKGASCSWSNK
jgi:hypothetical protein